MKLKKNAFYNILLTGSSLVLPLFTFPYVTRILAPEGIGHVNFANSFIQYFVILTSLGIPLYGIREVAKVKDSIRLRSKILFELLLIKIICTFFGILLYLILIYSIGKFHASLQYYLFGIATIIIGVFDLNYFFYALEDFKYITTRTVFFQIVSVIITFVLIKTKEDTLIYFCIPIVISLLNTLINTKYILRFISFKALYLKLNMRAHVKPLLLLFSVGIFTSIYNLLDVTILGFISGDASIGYYTVASKINKIPLSLIMVLVPVMLPRIAVEFKNENHDEINRLITKTLQFVILLGVPIMVGLYLLAPEIIALFSGKAFASSITTLRIMCPVILIIGMTTNFSTQLLIPMGQDKELLYAVIVGTIVSLVLNFILIPIFEQNGAAISNLVAELFVLICCYLYVRKKIKIKIPYQQLIVFTLLCIPFWGIVIVCRKMSSVPLTILISALCICVAYFTLLQVFILKNKIVLEVLGPIKNKIFKKNI
ncbi:flippase [Mucilaginibacter jinjuensis]|uniref:Flippase n=1 Tax=Mucilaginibacter jinjuensis TaxID=1176721 RepID=A0ABY7TBS8_9SPHI|nr:flippase [Mucilaginibacter jinjuensis]WCT13163.1 flippase [Mucilaginibacter jinjuensis]